MGKPDFTPTSRMPSAQELEHAASVFHLLADHTRLGILATLIYRDELSVSDIAQQLGRPLPAISQQLSKLKAGRLVEVRRQGTSMFYRITGEHVGLLVENLLQHVEHEVFTEPPHHQKN